MNFFLNIWLYLAFAMVGAVGLYLYTNKERLNIYRIISGLALMGFPLHMFEERIFPAGFHYIFEVFSGGQQTQFNVMLMNSAALIILTLLFIKKGDRPWFVGVMSFFCTMECILHTIMAIQSYSLFHEAGLVIPYSPGYFTCIVMFLPLGIWGFVSLIKSKDFTWNKLKWMIPWMLVICVLTLALPNKLLSGVGTPYSDFGFYQNYIG